MELYLGVILTKHSLVTRMIIGDLVELTNFQEKIVVIKKILLRINLIKS